MEEKTRFLKIFCRVRPFQRADDTKPCVSINEQDELVFEKNLRGSESSKREVFNGFERVLGPDVSQDSVYENSLLPMMKVVVENRQSGLFMAYGATSSGKSHTIFGKGEDSSAGLLPRAIKTYLDALTEDESLSLSMFEFYSNKPRKDYIYDLLTESTSSKEKPVDLPLKDQSQDMFVSGIVEERFQSYNEGLKILEKGLQKRITEKTGINDHSSRSHCVIILKRSTPSGIWEGECPQNGQLTVVDLAGCERNCDTGNVGVQLFESNYINNSFMGIGKGFRQLRECQEKGMDPPPVNRDLKILHFLKYAFMGLCPTVLMVNISPSPTQESQTLHVLKDVSKYFGIKITALNPVVTKTFGLPSKTPNSKSTVHQAKNSTPLVLSAVKFSNRFGDLRRDFTQKRKDFGLTENERGLEFGFNSEEFEVPNPSKDEEEEGRNEGRDGSKAQKVEGSEMEEKLLREMKRLKEMEKKKDQIIREKVLEIEFQKKIVETFMEQIQDLKKQIRKEGHFERQIGPEISKKGQLVEEVKKYEEILEDLRGENRMLIDSFNRSSFLAESTIKESKKLTLELKSQLEESQARVEELEKEREKTLTLVKEMNEISKEAEKQSAKKLSQHEEKVRENEELISALKIENLKLKESLARYEKPKSLEKTPRKVNYCEGKEDENGPTERGKMFEKVEKDSLEPSLFPKVKREGFDLISNENEVQENPQNDIKLAPNEGIESSNEQKVRKTRGKSKNSITPVVPVKRITRGSRKKLSQMAPEFVDLITPNPILKTSVRDPEEEYNTEISTLTRPKIHQQKVEMPVNEPVPDGKENVDDSHKLVSSKRLPGRKLGRKPQMISENFIEATLGAAISPKEDSQTPHKPHFLNTFKSSGRNR